MRGARAAHFLAGATTVGELKKHQLFHSNAFFKFVIKLYGLKLDCLRPYYCIKYRVPVLI